MHILIDLFSFYIESENICKTGYTIWRMAPYVCRDETNDPWKCRCTSLSMWSISHQATYCSYSCSLHSVSTYCKNILTMGDSILFGHTNFIQKQKNKLLTYLWWTSFRDVPVDNVVVRCGEWDSQKENEPLRHQIRQAEHIHPHPEFHKINVHNDLAVIHLNTSFQLSEHINPICLSNPKVNCAISCQLLVTSCYYMIYMKEHSIYNYLLCVLGQWRLQQGRLCCNWMGKRQIW